MSNLLSTITALAGRTVRGIRDSLPGGYVIGRLGGGSGPAQLIDLQSIVDTAAGQKLLAANPTATAKDTAVNGTALTYMRSDGAPAVQKTSSSQFGIAKVDGTTITASGGVISAVSSGGGNMLPLVNGDTPGPALIADPYGQSIGVSL